MTGKLEGKTALIVGASAGIGLASAKLFAAEGANVVLVGRSESRLREAEEEIGSQAVSVAADVQDADRLESAFGLAMERWGRLDVVFNNAGPGGDSQRRLLTEMSLELFDEYIAVNLRAVWLGMKFGIPLLERSGGGSIISTSSVGRCWGSRRRGRIRRPRPGCIR